MDDGYKLNKPIFLIGAARSGTTVLGDILGHHEDLAYWIEPKYIWRYKKAGAVDDLRSAQEATPTVKKYITSKFFRYVEKNQKLRFIEKTPSNVFRVPFINEIFPNGRYIHLIRDGRDVSLSAYRKSKSKPTESAIKRRLFSNEIPILELPFYIKEGFKQVVLKFLLKSKPIIWGPRYEGFINDSKKLSMQQLTAKQWVESINVATQELSHVNQDHLKEVRFEKLLKAPRETIYEIMKFLELEISEKVLDYAEATLDVSQVKKSSEEERRSLSEAEDILLPCLKSLGYV